MANYITFKEKITYDENDKIEFEFFFRKLFVPVVTNYDDTMSGKSLTTMTKCPRSQWANTFQRSPLTMRVGLVIDNADPQILNLAFIV